MIKDKFKEICNELSEYKPGKTKEEISKKHQIPKDKIVALASNENPYGTPKKAKKAIKDVSNKVHRYPSPKEEKELRKEIKNYLNLSDNYQVILGAGEDGVLENIMNTFIEKNDKVIIPYPTFSLYEILSKIHGAKIEYVKRKKDFSIPQEEFLEKTKEAKLVFICSPNNPTGNLVKKSLLKKLLKQDIFVVLDTAYAELTEENYIDLLDKNDNLIILRTLSKAFGLAGLRVGYGLIKQKEVAKNIRKTKSPFNVSKPALVAGKKALQSNKFLEKTIKTIKEQRQHLTKNIPFKTKKSEANYVLADVSPKKSQKVTKKLMDKGIIVRDCSSMKGMGDKYIRISVGKPSENNKAIQALKRI